MGFPVVQQLDGRAFSGCLNLTNITLPKEMYYIGPYCFCGCPHLEEFTLPELIFQALHETAFVDDAEPQKLQKVGYPSDFDAFIEFQHETTTPFLKLLLPNGNFQTLFGKTMFVGGNNVKMHSVPSL